MPAYLSASQALVSRYRQLSSALLDYLAWGLDPERGYVSMW